MRMPDAVWKPIGSNYAPGNIGRVIGCVIHHMVSSEESAFAHFNSPGSGASAHFGVTYEGEIFQYVDTGDAAYHACGANYAGQIGIENESASSGDLWQPLTDDQVSACARILAWAHDAHGVELRLSDPGDRRGLGYHAMVPGPCTANDWGSTGCPGDAIVAQRPEILRRAQSGGAPPPVELERKDDVVIWKEVATGAMYLGGPGYWAYIGDPIAAECLTRPGAYGPAVEINAVQVDAVKLVCLYGQSADDPTGAASVAAEAADAE